MENENKKKEEVELNEEETEQSVENSELNKTINEENKKKDRSFLIVFSILGGLLIIALIVIIVLNSLPQNGGNGTCDNCSGINTVITSIKNLL